MDLYRARFFVPLGNDQYRIVAADSQDPNAVDALDVPASFEGEVQFLSPQSLNGRYPVMFLGIGRDVADPTDLYVEGVPTLLTAPGQQITVNVINGSGAAAGTNLAFWFAEVDKFTSI